MGIRLDNLCPPLPVYMVRSELRLGCFLFSFLYDYVLAIIIPLPVFIATKSLVALVLMYPRYTNPDSPVPGTKSL